MHYSLPRFSMFKNVYPKQKKNLEKNGKMYGKRVFNKIDFDIW